VDDDDDDDDDDDVSICWWLLFCEKEGVVHRSGCVAVFHHTIKARPGRMLAAGSLLVLCCGRESSLSGVLNSFVSIRHPSETVHGVAKYFTCYLTVVPCVTGAYSTYLHKYSLLGSRNKKYAHALFCPGGLTHTPLPMLS